MYERNAIVIDRYFANIYGYDKTNNLKNNSNNYFDLVNNLENYQEASEAENNIMAEFERVANKIKETQKLQDVLNKRSLKYNEVRKTLFENLDEDAEALRKKFDKVEEDIDKNNQEIKENADKFIEEIIEFNEKSETRSNSGRERRIVESEYQNILKLTTDNFNNINKEKLKEIKNFVKSQDKSEAKEAIKEKILKNGAKEKVPFDENAITSAIDVSTYVEEKKAEILLSLFDKTTKLLDEIKNDTVKIDKHKKIVKDAQSKLEFLNVISEYIILFLDNERMNTMGGIDEHKKNMAEACSNLQSDLIEIQNMYSLLVKEMTGKSSKKAYKDLYNLEYLLELQQNQKQFEENISKLHMIGTVVYPDYWRVEGMQKIYDTFKNIMTDVYEKDLSEFEPLDITFSVNEEALEASSETDDEDETSENIDTTETTSENNEIEQNTSDDEEQDELEDDVNISEDNNEEEESNNDEEFVWDDEDEDDELIFNNNSFIVNKASEYEDEDDSDTNTETTTKQDDEDEKDKEIDEILGIFDNADDLDEDLFDDNDEDEDIDDFSIDAEDIEDENDINSESEEDEIKEEKPKRKKKLFARKKK